VRLVSRQRLRFALNSTVIVVALVVTGIDALSKTWARHVLATHADHLLGPLWLRLQFNAGISFSINQSGPLLTTVLTLIVALIVVVVGVRARPGLPAAGFGLLLGGGLANVIDRLVATPHRVTDFIAIGSFPVFNLADVAITAGFVILLVAALRGESLLVR
jgi:signal peptidase II